MKKIDFDLESNPFINFQSARYTMSARVKANKTYKYSKDHGYSFFLITLGCIIKAANQVRELKRRIDDGEVIEYDYLDGVTPIMKEEDKVYREMRVDPPMKYDTVEEWHELYKNLKEEILSLKKDGFEVEMERRDLENIVNCSCIPWVDFDVVTSCEVKGHQIQPLITWGKYNDNGEISVSITVSHIFVNGQELGHFYRYLQESLNNPSGIIKGI